MQAEAEVSKQAQQKQVKKGKAAKSKRGVAADNAADLEKSQADTVAGDEAPASTDAGARMTTRKGRQAPPSVAAAAAQHVEPEPVATGSRKGKRAAPEPASAQTKKASKTEKQQGADLCSFRQKAAPNIHEPSEWYFKSVTQWCRLRAGLIVFCVQRPVNRKLRQQLQ